MAPRRRLSWSDQHHAWELENVSVTRASISSKPPMKGWVLMKGWTQSVAYQLAIWPILPRSKGIAMGQQQGQCWAATSSLLAFLMVSSILVTCCIGIRLWQALSKPFKISYCRLNVKSICLCSQLDWMFLSSWAFAAAGCCKAAAPADSESMVKCSTSSLLNVSGKIIEYCSTIIEPQDEFQINFGCK
jgi:hypothetical protein